MTDTPPAVKQLVIFFIIFIFGISMLPTLFFTLEFIELNSTLQSPNYELTDAGERELHNSRWLLTIFGAVSLFFFMFILALIFDKSSNEFPKSLENKPLPVLCEHCDKPIERDSVFCKHCGNIHIEAAVREANELEASEHPEENPEQETEERKGRIRIKT